ncbi:MAG: ComF family protein [Burkholderiaceae bacterium]|nr:ComF family protein [Burkholderiaceae bacterium]
MSFGSGIMLTHSPLASVLLDMALPPLCLNCDAPVSRNQSLCPDCWKAISFISDPCCQRCGLPFEVPVEAGTLCTDCLTDPPDYTAGRSVFLYDDASKEMILKFKHGDQMHPAIAMGEWLAKAASDFMPQLDVIIPVPLHYWRLWRRRYNQAALLAQKISQFTGKPVDLQVLQRVKPTHSQGHHNRTERHKNMSKAFRVSSSRREQIDGKTVLLVDDVLTTGSTIHSLATTLKQSGAKRVTAWTMFRTPPWRA